MNVLKTSPKFILFVLFYLVSFASYAQVGINNDNPDKCAILQISDTNRGVILPQISDDASISITPLSDGLLYYNTTEHRFRYFNNTDWQCLNSWSSTANVNEITTDKKVTVTNTINATTLAATTVNATTLNGFGTIPIGGIIMWSGTTIPNGWALCDGNSASGYTTPNLSGRFIVSYDGTGAKPEYNNPGNLSNQGGTGGNTGGNDNFTINLNNLPAHVHDAGNLVMSKNGDHSHNISSSGNRGPGGGGREPQDYNLTLTNNSTSTDGAHKHIISGTTAEGGGVSAPVAINSRPAYYVLAFIMRVQ